MEIILPYLGVGLSYRSQFAAEVFKYKEKIGFLEIVADHYIDCTYEKKEELKLLKDHFVLIPHAINLSLGSADGINQAYSEKLASLISYINPPWWSEHISFSKIGDIEIGHLTPLPYTKEAVELFSENVKHVQKIIPTPLILENISYLVTIPNREMNESDFILKILKNTDCGLLFDLTNLHYNAINNGYDAKAFIQSIPKEKIVQFHFTGGITKWDKLIDNHSTPTPPEVWELMKFIKQTTNVKGAILERDDPHPDFNELLVDLEMATAIMAI
jgi:uncharacterized protein (UPF0276 family)